MVDRSVIIGGATGTGGTIFSMAHRSVTAAGADQLNIIKQVALPESYDYVVPMGGIVPPGMPMALAHPIGN
jgi:hypothetical protein